MAKQNLMDMLRAGLERKQTVNKALERDLIDLSDILEGFVAKLDKMSQADLVDLGARVKSVTKACKTIDEHVKGMVKAKRKGVEGAVLGNLFKAVLTLIPIDRLDTKALKEAKPTVYASFLRHNEDERVTFEVR